MVLPAGNDAVIAQSVERILGKDEVASSNLAISSRKSFIFEGFFFIYAHFLQVLPFHPAKRRPHLLFRQKSVSWGFPQSLAPQGFAGCFSVRNPSAAVDSVAFFDGFGSVDCAAAAFVVVSQRHLRRGMAQHLLHQLQVVGGG